MPRKIAKLEALLSPKVRSRMRQVLSYEDQNHAVDCVKQFANRATNQSIKTIDRPDYVQAALREILPQLEYDRIYGMTELHEFGIACKRGSVLTALRSLPPQKDFAYVHGKFASCGRIPAFDIGLVRLADAKESGFTPLPGNTGSYQQWLMYSGTFGSFDFRYFTHQPQKARLRCLEEMSAQVELLGYTPGVASLAHRKPTTRERIFSFLEESDVGTLVSDFTQRTKTRLVFYQGVSVFAYDPLLLRERCSTFRGTYELYLDSSRHIQLQHTLENTVSCAAKTIG